MNESQESTQVEPTDQAEEGNETTETPSIFSSIPSALSRRFAIHDVVYESPQYSNQGVPGADGDAHDLGTNGLLSNLNPLHPEFATPEILAELPPECKEALIQAASHEWQWKSKWRNETDDGARFQPTKSYAWFP